MNIKRENARHERVISRINEAKSISELPSVTYNDIANLLAEKEYYGEKISKEALKPVVDAIIKYGLKSEKVIYSLNKVLIAYFYEEKHVDFDAEEIKASILYKEIIDEGKLVHLYEEIKKIEAKKRDFIEKAEDSRHIDVVTRIYDAKELEDIPSVSFSDISKYLASKDYFGTKINQTAFKSYINALINYGNPLLEEVYNVFESIVVKYALGNVVRNDTKTKIKELYKKLIREGNISHLLFEIGIKNSKEYRLQSEHDYKLHMVNMCVINNVFEESNFPKVGIGELNRLILRAVNSNGSGVKVKTADIESISKIYLKNGNGTELENAIEEFVNSFIPEESRSEAKLEILGSLLADKNIDYRAEEIIAIEKRRREIIKNDHDELMDLLKDATRMYQLPSISFSTLTSYLCGNSTIYANDNRFKSEHFKNITGLLLDGKKWEDIEIRKELNRICDLLYPDKVDAFSLLFKKLSSLPKTYYLVLEINLIKKLQEEFIKNGSSNVHVYFYENSKAPSEGGKFYNVYISRNERLDLRKIVPSGMDIDSVEWYVRQVDKSFKTVGGIILFRDEKISSISVYSVNDGQVTLTDDEKVIFDGIKDLKVENEALKRENEALKLENSLLQEENENLLKHRRELEEDIERKVLEKQEVEKSTEIYVYQNLERYKKELARLSDSIVGTIKAVEDYQDDISGFVKKIEPPKE